MKFLILTFLFIGSFLSMPVSAQDSADTQYDNGYYDPFEPMNRAFFQFNMGVDRFILAPVIRGYRFTLPKEGRLAIRNVFRNLRAPVDFTNNLLQGDLKGSGTILFRFVTNTLTGFGGLLDVAGYEGYEYKSEDFGQTLAKWGVTDGPYIVLPLLGPASMRDGIGYGVDGLFQPINHYARNTEEHYMWYYNGSSYFELSNQLYDVKRDIYKNSLDPYSSMKSIVYQNRQAQIADRNGRNRSKEYSETTSQKETVSSDFYFDIPDYEDF